jgi:hypothetical protein
MANPGSSKLEWRVVADWAGQPMYKAVTPEEFLNRSNDLRDGVPVCFSNIRKPRLINVIFRNPTTITEWSDGDKIICNAINEEFSEEKGLAKSLWVTILNLMKH